MPSRSVYSIQCTVHLVLRSVLFLERTSRHFFSFSFFFFFRSVCVGEHPCAVMLVGPIRADRVGPGTWIGGGQ